MKRAISSMVALAAVAMTPSLASAEPVEIAEQAEVNNVVSLDVLGLLGRGVAGQYERRINSRVSALVGLGMRARAAADYESLTLSTNAEARWWFTRRSPFSGFTAPAMVGLYLGARVDIARTSTRDEERDESLGAVLAIAEDVSVGYRFAFWRRLEVTPSAGVGLRHEFDLEGRLPAWTRASLSFGLTIGAMF